MAALKQRERSLLPAPSQGGSLRVHFVYPNSYQIALSSLGYQLVYRLFSEQPGVVVERAFSSLKEGGRDPLSPPKTFESARALGDCDLLAFCCQFELDYFNLFRLLLDLGLLLPSAERSRRRRSGGFDLPLILLGGNAITLNPEPLADYSDLILIGEAEESLPELLNRLIEARQQRLDEERLFWELSQITGVYLPRYYLPQYNQDQSLSCYLKEDPITNYPSRSFVSDLDKHPAYSSFISENTVFDSLFLVETGRCCEMGCRFCAAASLAQPVRKRSAEQIAEAITIGLEQCDSVGFIGAAVSSHPAITELTAQVVKAGGRASLSSLMVKKVTKQLAELIAQGETRSVALAPEAGSDRLRQIVGKRFSNSDLIESVVVLVRAGIDRIKLYFMIGLPGENDQDLVAIINLIKQVQQVLQLEKGAGRSLQLIVSINPFVPKAWTPFQWEPFCELVELQRRLDLIRQQTKALPRLKLTVEQPRDSYIQAVLSRGDRRLALLLVKAVTEKLSLSWLVRRRSEIIVRGVPPLDFYAKRRIGFEEILPWEIVDFGLSRKRLQQQAQIARQEMVDRP